MNFRYLIFTSIFVLGCSQSIEHYKYDLLPNAQIFVESELREDTTRSFQKFDTIYIDRIDTLTPKERSTYFANVLSVRLDIIKMNSNSIRDILKITKNREYLRYYGNEYYSNDKKDWTQLDAQQKDIDKVLIPLFTKTIDSLNKIKDSINQYDELYSAGIIYRYVNRNFTLDSGSRYIWFNKKLNLVDPYKNYNIIFSDLNALFQNTNDLYLRVSRH
jgi:hypothetical protein